MKHLDLLEKTCKVLSRKSADNVTFIFFLTSHECF